MQNHALDKIHIRDLRIYCIVGIYPHERDSKQEVNLNITLEADLSEACKSDQIEDTINYKKLKQEVLALVETSSYFLIERMAEAVAALCLEDARVVRCTVCVDKPGALTHARSVAVEVQRSRAS